MSKLHCVVDDDGFGFLVHHLEEAVVIHVWSNVVAVPRPKVPGLAFSGIGVGE